MERKLSICQRFMCVNIYPKTNLDGKVWTLSVPVAAVNATLNASVRLSFCFFCCCRLNNTTHAHIYTCLVMNEFITFGNDIRIDVKLAAAQHRKTHLRQHEVSGALESKYNQHLSFGKSKSIETFFAPFFLVWINLLNVELGQINRY